LIQSFFNCFNPQRQKKEFILTINIYKSLNEPFNAHIFTQASKGCLKNKFYRYFLIIDIKCYFGSSFYIYIINVMLIVLNFSVLTLHLTSLKITHQFFNVNSSWLMDGVNITNIIIINIIIITSLELLLCNIIF
jgi:hypothetical protein